MPDNRIRLPFSEPDDEHDEQATMLVEFANQLELYGIDILTMLLLVFVIVALLVVTALNIYLKITQQTNKSVNPASAKRSQSARKTSVNEEIDSKHQDAVGSSYSNSFGTPFSLPTVTGNDAECNQWIGNVVQWLYTSVKQSHLFVCDHSETWISALNDKSNKLSTKVRQWNLFLASV